MEYPFLPVGQWIDLDRVPTKAGGKLCLGMECLDRDLWDADRAMDLIGQLGIRRARLQTGWQKTEQTPGVYDFAWLDDVVDQLLSRGIKPFLSLSYGNRLYCSNPDECPNLENGGVGHIPIATERERDAWRNYVRALVSHFRDRVNEYEIWNEPDCAIFCRTPTPWPDAYMTLVKMTQPIIRELAPKATVITCTAGFEALRPLIDRGMGDYADVHSFHGYQFFPEMQTLDYYRNHLRYALKAAPHLRFWRGEAGCPSYNDPISQGALSDVQVSETKQAKFLLRHLLMDFTNDLIDCTSYFHAYDFEHFTHRLRYYYGVIRHEPLSRKPSYHSLQALAHLFDADTAHQADSCLTFRGGKSEELLKMQFAAFTRKGMPFYTYYIAHEITDVDMKSTIELDIPMEIARPVVLDPLTRDVYEVRQSIAPLKDYPLFLMDADAAEEFATFTLSTQGQPKEALDQRTHE